MTGAPITAKRAEWASLNISRAIFLPAAWKANWMHAAEKAYLPAAGEMAPAIDRLSILVAWSARSAGAFSLAPNGMLGAVCVRSFAMPSDVSKTTREPVSHERAREAARRLIKGSFRRDGERLEREDQPRFTIPCRPDADDDVVLMNYIRQQEALHRG